MDKKETKLKDLKKALEEYKTGWQRTQADFENYRKRMEAQRLELTSCANCEMVEKILPILDNLELAIKHLPKEMENNDWTKGIVHIKNQFEGILKTEGVEKIADLGHFDPNIHEAISHEKSQLAEDEIIEVVQPGYKLGAKIIRPARVRVSCGQKK